MQFQMGEKVVHPVYGVGTITTLSKQQFFGEKAYEYYQVVIGTATIWVPINDQGSTVLRKIAPKESLNECRRVLKSHPVALNQDRKKRELELAHLLKDKLPPALCETVSALRARSKQKTLGITENNLLKKTLQALGGEWAASDGVTVQTALGEIESLLQEAG